MHHSKRGDEKAAERVARRFLRWRPTDPEAWGMLSGALIAQGDLDGAEHVLREGIQRTRDDELLRYYLADLLMPLPSELEHKAELESKAREEIAQLREKYPDSPLPFVALARLAEGAEDWPTVEVNCDVALQRLDPSTRVGWLALKFCGDLLVRVPSRRTEGISILQRFLPRRPHDAKLHLRLSVALEAEGRTDEANAHMERARANWVGDEESFLAELETHRMEVCGGGRAT